MKKIICDLFKKYEKFIKYVFSSGVCFVLDILLFSFVSYVLNIYLNEARIIIATIVARVISSFVNYLLNGNVVFKSSDKVIEKSTVIKYYTLVVVQLCVSSFSVYFLYQIFSINETLIKIPVDIVIFIVNYVVQKKFIFVKRG